MSDQSRRTGRLEVGPAYDSPAGEHSKKPKKINFEAKLREISVNRDWTSRHCKADRPVATKGR